MTHFLMKVISLLTNTHAEEKITCHAKLIFNTEHSMIWQKETTRTGKK